VLAATVAATAVWSWELLSRTPEWHPLLRQAVLVAGVAASVGLLAATRLRRAAIVTVAVLAFAAGLAGPAAYALETAATPHTGAIPTAGPSGSVQGGLGPARPFSNLGQPGLQDGIRRAVRQDGLGRQVPVVPGPPSNGRPGTGGTAGGGLLEASTPGTDLVSILTEDTSSYRWAAAVVGANSAAGYQLATQEPVLAIGGFNGTDPWPTLEEFQTFVAAHEIHYFIGGDGPGGRGGFGGRSTDSNEIANWVANTFTSTTIDGVTVYDLSQS
jgi:4-amino-4-deoxy-L-arabinose transferase-like glycosyltransferase